MKDKTSAVRSLLRTMGADSIHQTQTQSALKVECENSKPNPPTPPKSNAKKVSIDHPNNLSSRNDLTVSVVWER